MRLFAFALIFFASFAFIEAWMRTQSRPANFDGYCHDKEKNSIGKLRVDEKKQLTDICGIAMCDEEGDLTKMGCFTVSGKGCRKTPGNPKAPYPSCCDKYVCS